MARSADKLIDQIKKEIAEGTLKPGDQLEESVLSDRFNLSRTPIREAIRSMVDSGLLETRPRKGAIVRVLSAKELLELFDVAAELEGMACRLAASTLTDAGAEALQSSVEKCQTASEVNDIKGYGRANLQFHSAIHKACDNSWLIEQLKQIELRINAYRSMPFEVRGRLKKSTEEHKEICQAILDGEGEKARDLMRDHMMLQGKRMLSIINTIESQNRGN